MQPSPARWSRRLMGCWLVGLLAALLPAAALRAQRPAVAAPRQNVMSIKNQPLATPTPGKNLLAIYALAFDQPMTSTMNLTPQYTETLKYLVQATVGHPDKTAVVLADLDGPADTHIRILHNGVITNIIGLPDASGTLSPTLREYDMADGSTLGGFLRWARGEFQASTTTFSFVGHGAPLPPETTVPLPALFGARPCGGASVGPRPAPAAVVPLPINIGANPEFTDHHTPRGTCSLLTPYALAQALNIGSQGGAVRFQVVDIMMCFGASIEEFYEAAPYTEELAGSPNYLFWSAKLPGAALAALNPSDLPAALASTLITTYHAQLPPTPPTGHPRILVAVAADRLAGVVSTWNQVATSLAAMLSSPATAADTRAAILGAYQASAKYNSTFCAPQDWYLKQPDALVDMASFAAQLSASSYFSKTAIVTDAQQTAQLVRAAITARVAADGMPWFDTVAPTDTWAFGAGPVGDARAAGLSLYADFGGTLNSLGQIPTSWHSAYYTDTVTAANPKPYKFVQLSAWDTVFAEFWQGYTLKPSACMPILPPAQQRGDLIAGPLLLPSTLALGRPVALSGVVTSTAVINNPAVHFTVIVSGTTMFTETVSAGLLVSGTHTLTTRERWRPTSTAPYVVRMTVDSNEEVIEASEANNVTQLSGEILGTAAPPSLAATVQRGQQLFASSTVPLLITPTAALSELTVQVYQPGPPTAEWVYPPALVATLHIANPTLPLSPDAAGQRAARRDRAAPVGLGRRRPQPRARGAAPQLHPAQRPAGARRAPYFSHRRRARRPAAPRAQRQRRPCTAGLGAVQCQPADLPAAGRHRTAQPRPGAADRRLSAGGPGRRPAAGKLFADRPARRRPAAPGRRAPAGDRPAAVPISASSQSHSRPAPRQPRRRLRPPLPAPAPRPAAPRRQPRPPPSAPAPRRQSAISTAICRWC